MDRTERESLIRRYAEGPDRLQEALSTVPSEAMMWRPAPNEWSAHEVICHCADSETSSSTRIRMLVAQPEPLIVGYDQEAWAVVMEYHRQPLGPALDAVRATRASTAALLPLLPEEAWIRTGQHTEFGDFSAETWLRYYADHLHDHADQIEANVATWKAQSS
jgi:hypothetical protein